MKTKSASFFCGLQIVLMSGLQNFKSRVGCPGLAAVGDATARYTMASGSSLLVLLTVKTFNEGLRSKISLNRGYSGLFPRWARQNVFFECTRERASGLFLHQHATLDRVWLI